MTPQSRDSRDDPQPRTPPTLHQCDNCNAHSFRGGECRIPLEVRPLGSGVVRCGGTRKPLGTTGHRGELGDRTDG